MQKEFFFDELTARDVAERLRVLNEIQAYLNAVVLTVGRLNGAGPQDRVQLNQAGTGVVVTVAEVSPILPPSRGDGVAPGMAGEIAEDASNIATKKKGAKD